MDNKKRIGIDARFWGAKDKGFGRYAENLVKELEKLDKKNQYFVFLRKNSWNEYAPKNKNFKKVLADYKWYGLREQIFLPIKMKQYKLDLVHFTHFNVPIFYYIPFLRGKGKFIVTIHDITIRYFPTFKKNLKNFFFYPIKKIAYLLAFKNAVKKSEKIIAISKYTKKEILKHYNVSSDKIKVIYEGIEQGLKPKSLNPNRKILKPYILYAGNAYPHKNLERLILAFKKISKDFPNMQLVLAGGDDYFYQRLKQKISREKQSTRGDVQPNEAISNFSKKVIFTGFISDEELGKLYQNAALFVFPSLSEGFGLPPLEAMDNGTPVASSSAACLPEILGKAAIYFNPLDVNDMAKQIKKALLDKNLRKILIKKGFEQVKKYSWKKMAEKTLDIYEL